MIAIQRSKIDNSSFIVSEKQETVEYITEVFHGNCALSYARSCNHG